jgi:hypothetical protein
MLRHDIFCSRCSSIVFDLLFWVWMLLHSCAIGRGSCTLFFTFFLFLFLRQCVPQTGFSLPFIFLLRDMWLKGESDGWELELAVRVLNSQLEI